MGKTQKIREVQKAKGWGRGWEQTLQPPLLPNFFRSLSSRRTPLPERLAQAIVAQNKPTGKFSGALCRRGGKRKESLKIRLWNLSICIEKVVAKCWLAEMTLVMTWLPLARAFQCLFTFVLVSASHWLAEIWQLSRRQATGKLEVEFKFQRRSCKLSFLFPPSRQSAPGSLLAG